MTSEAAFDGANVTSIHSPFSALLPSCQQVRGSPSMAFPGWNFARSPTTDEATAPVSTRATGLGATGDGAAVGSPDGVSAVGAPPEGASAEAAPVAAPGRGPTEGPDEATEAGPGPLSSWLA